MKKRNLQTALRMARELYNRLSETCEFPDCHEFDACPFRDHICLDVDTIIANLEMYLR
jgi:hypothetical protein